MFLTPMIIVFTSPSDGFPITVILLLGLSLSYSEYACTYAACPAAFCLLRSFLMVVNLSSGMSSMFSSGHTATLPSCESL